MLSQCPGPQQRRQATGATMTPACCRGIWAGASLACLRLVYGLWEAGSAARDSCWTCLVVNFTATFYLLIVTLEPLSFIRKHAEFELTTDTPDHSVPSILPELLQILFLWKKKRFCDASAAISLLSISVLSPDSYSWSSERIVYSCRNVFNSVEDVLICHQVCFSLEVHWRSANHNPSSCRWRKRLNRVWEVSLLTAAERHNEDYTPDVSRPEFLMKDPEAEWWFR